MRWHASDIPRWARGASESSIIASACLAPWAFGAVEAWAELAVDLGIAMAALLGAVAGRRAGGRDSLACGPSLALAGLSLLGLLQAMPMPMGLLDRIAPASASLHRSAAPDPTERVLGDPLPAVKPPASTISIRPEGSLRATARLATAWVLFQCVFGLGGGHRALRRFGQATAINAAAIALFALVQGLTWDGQIYWSRPSPIRGEWHSGGPFVGHSALAAYLNLGLGLALGELLTRRDAGPGRWGRGIWDAFVASLVCVGLIASHSRSGVVGAVAASAVLAGTEWRGLRRLGARWLVVPGLVLAMLIASSITSPYQRLASLLDSASYAERLELWGATIRAWSGYRFVGSGLGSFADAVAPQVRTDYGVIFGRAENEYVDVLLEGGLIGLAIVLAGLVALAGRGSRALSYARSPRDRAVVSGALFGLVALAVQGVADFSPHIPGVAITAVVLAAHVCALGAPAGRVAGGVARTAQGLGIAALCLGLLPHDLAWARAEAQLGGTGLPPPGSSLPSAVPVDLPVEALERRRAALEAALRDRPDWAEGHYRLGLTLVALYERTAADWLAPEVDGPAMVATIADPLWLHDVAQTATAEEVLGQEPVSLFLVPAARCFLEARRCAPGFAAVHARLGSLEYLLEGRDPAPAYAIRAMESAGCDRGTLSLAARVALQSGHPEVAARCWRRCIEARPWDWEDTADVASASLTPEQVLDQALPPGAGWPIAFADRAYAGPEDQDVQARFLRTALERLPGDAALSTAERRYLEARARGRLGQHDRAGPLYEAALRLEPLRGDWREEYVAWLVDRGDFAAAHRHAVLGVRLNPDRAGLRRNLELSAEALARGGPRP